MKALIEQAGWKTVSHEEVVDFNDDRSWFIGGSDAGAIRGNSKYSSPLDVYIEKVEKIREVVDNDFIKTGKEKEDVIREFLIPRYFAREGKEVTTYEVNEWFSHPRFEWMVAHIDGMIYHPDHGIGGLEIKTVSPFAHGDWLNNKTPQGYVDQVLHYMAVTGANYWLLFADCGSVYQVRFFHRDDFKDEISQLIDDEYSFWNMHILSHVPPEPRFPSDTKTLNIMFPVANGKTVQLPVDTLPIIERRIAVGQERKALDEEKDILDAKLKAHLGENEVGLVGDHMIRWVGGKGARRFTVK